VEGVPLPSGSDFELYIVADKDRILVARQRPAIEGRYERTVRGRIVNLTLLPYVLVSPGTTFKEERGSRVRPEAPGVGRAKTLSWLGCVAGVVVAGVLGYLTTYWLAVPLALGIAGYAVFRQLTSESTLTAQWQRDHRWLTHRQELSTFDSARRAAERIMDAWPELDGLVGVPDPSRTLARSLWELSGELVDRATVRGTRDELALAQVGLPPEAAITREVVDRLSQLNESLAQLDANLDRRVRSLVGFADECWRFVREQQAIAQVRDAIEGADSVLGSVAQAFGTPPDSSEELGERTRAVLNAYRELTDLSG
jgi:hypothetical protein